MGETFYSVPSLERYCGVGTEVSDKGLLLTTRSALTFFLKTWKQSASRISAGVYSLRVTWTNLNLYLDVVLGSRKNPSLVLVGEK